MGSSHRVTMRGTEPSSCCARISTSVRGGGDSTLRTCGAQSHGRPQTTESRDAPQHRTEPGCARRLLRAPDRDPSRIDRCAERDAECEARAAAREPHRRSGGARPGDGGRTGGYRMTTSKTGTVPTYMSGFGNEFATEALAGALPIGRNSPQKVAYGLYAEQFSGTAFTAPRHANRRSWLYRIRPAAVHEPFVRHDNGAIVSDFSSFVAPPN